jgi:hypothetical protein
LSIQRMRRSTVSVVVAVLASIVALGAMAGVASATTGHVTVGPAGYITPGGETLIVAGTQPVPTVGSGDHVVICHALGNGGYNQEAPSAGDVFGHAGASHQDGKDIIPPFKYVDNQGNENDSLVNGQNWTGDYIATYNNGCVVPTPPPATGVLRVCKTLVDPTNSGDKFDLKVDGTVVKAAAGNGDCGDKTVTVGSHTASESAAGNASLDNYTVTYSESCPNGAASVTAEHTTTCTITNTRKQAPPPATGVLRVCKTLVDPTNSGDKFDLKVDGTVVKAAAGNGDCGDKTVTVGSHTASESAAGNASLDNYTVTYSESCPNGAASVTAEHTTTCTITNTRKQAPPPETGTIKLCKQLVPTTDTGKFNLLVGNTVVLANAGNGDCKAMAFAPGNYVVSETAGTGTSLAGYNSRVDCVSSMQEVDPDGTSTNVTLHAGETLVCTFINARVQTPPSGSCPEGTTVISTNPLVCLKTVTNTVTQTVTVYGTPTCPAGSTQTSSGPGYVVCNTTTTVTAPAGTCPAGFTTVPGSNPVQCTKTVVKVVIKKVPVKAKPKPKPPHHKAHKPAKPKKHTTGKLGHTP